MTTRLKKSGMYVHCIYKGMPTLKQVVEHENFQEFQDGMEEMVADLMNIKWDDAKVIKQKSWFGQKLDDLEWWYWKKKHYWRRQR